MNPPRAASTIRPNCRTPLMPAAATLPRIRGAGFVLVINSSMALESFSRAIITEVVLP